MTTDVRIGWWNLENLFDSVGANRPAELQRRLAGELAGWTVPVRDRKIGRLASIVEQLFDGAGPDLLGVCEVENDNVVQLLIDEVDIAGRNYQPLIHPSPDARGIDTGFIFDANVLTPGVIGHEVLDKRTPSRDIFFADFTVNAENVTFRAVANHWPSRSAGQYESEPFRIIAGETLSFLIANWLETDLQLPIVVMGDFNDEPPNRAMTDYLLGTNDPGRVTAGPRRMPRLLNLMWPHLHGNDPGTLVFSGRWNMLDHFLISREIVRQGSDFTVNPASTQVFRIPDMMNGTRPRRHSRPSAASFDPDGFSDHFPIGMTLTARP